MKNVILSADSQWKVYSVPDVVADNLSKYCVTFCTKWLANSPQAKKYRMRGGFCYNEADFIEYLNRWVFPGEESVLVENLGWHEDKDRLPEPYTDCPRFHF